MPRRFALVLLLVTAISCGSPAGPTPPPPPPAPAPPPPPPGSPAIDGAWRLVYWIADTPGQPVRDFYELGGRLTITIADGKVSGTLTIPPGVAADSAFQVDMAGDVIVGDDTVQFVQEEDTFVGRAVWNIHQAALWIVGHAAGEMYFTVALLRDG